MKTISSFWFLVSSFWFVACGFDWLIIAFGEKGKKKRIEKSIFNPQMLFCPI